MTRFVTWNGGANLAIISDAPGGEGDRPTDLASPRNAPLTDIAGNLDLIHFNSRFDYFVAASGYPKTISMTLDAYDADTGTTFGALTAYIGHEEKDYDLGAHGQSGIPADFMAAVNGQEYPIGCPIQTGVNGGRRSISLWADDEKVWLHEDVKPGISGLPELDIELYLAVFRLTEDEPDLPLYSPNPAQLGRGRIKAGEVNLREAQDSDTAPFSLPTAPCGDASNGHFRFVLLDMTTYDVGPMVGKNSYAGDFWGGAQKRVGFAA